jgi:Lipid A core - O-antigen ligase and related enzymes
MVAPSNWVTLQKAVRSPQVVVAALVILLALLMRPGIVMHLQGGLIQELLNIGRWIAVVVSVLLYIWVIQIDVFGFLCIALGLLAFISLQVNNVGLYNFNEFWAPACATALLARAACEHHSREMLWATLLVSSAISLLNLASVLLFPGGIPGIASGGYYFFNGHRNWAIAAILPSVFSSLLLDDRRERLISIRSAALLLVGFAQLLLAYSATSLVALLCATIGIVLLTSRKMYAILNAYTYLVLNAVLFLFVVVFGLQNMFGFLIEDVLGKSMTFTGRTIIWEGVIERVLATNPLVGCGYDAFWNGNANVGSAHNMVLEIFAQGGFAGVAVFVILLLAVAHGLYACSKSRTAALLSLVIGCFLLIGLTEQIRWPAFFLFLGFSYGWSNSEIKKRCRQARLLVGQRNATARLYRNLHFCMTVTDREAIHI